MVYLSGLRGKHVRRNSSSGCVLLVSCAKQRSAAGSVLRARGVSGYCCVQKTFCSSFRMGLHTAPLDARTVYFTVCTTYTHRERERETHTHIRTPTYANTAMCLRGQTRGRRRRALAKKAPLLHGGSTWTTPNKRHRDDSVRAAMRTDTQDYDRRRRRCHTPPHLYS